MTDNEIIARFMDLDVDGVNVTDGNIETTLDKLQYDTSWEALMPVVEKINSTRDYSRINIDSDRAFLHLDCNNLRVFYKYNHGYMGMVYKAVIEFIKWYNSQTTKQ